MKLKFQWGYGFLLTCLWFNSALAADDPSNSAAVLASPTHSPALIAIIIDDLGDQLVLGRRAVALAAPVTCAVMPHTRFGALLAREANASGKEVMLHLPMQPMDMQRIAGQGEISLENGRAQLREILEHNLNTIPHVVGVNNHMGSLITRHPGHMGWLMDELFRRGDLFFVDSVTTPASVAYAAALEHGVPAARRHVFLDDDPCAEAISAQFERLKKEAAARGYAVGIGHPYPTTLAFLETVFKDARQNSEFRIVPVSTIISLLGQGVLTREQEVNKLIALEQPIPAPTQQHSIDYRQVHAH
jgi:polysaccharide deacetylase 2 family uncharacterized protein YibQ